MCNAYLIKGEDGYVAVDAPAGFAEQLMNLLPEPTALKHLLLTHQHFDHVQDARRIQELTGCTLHAAAPHGRELTLEALSACAGWIPAVPPYTVDDAFGSDGEAEYCGLKWQRLTIPGHSPDGTAYALPEAGVVFVGDILFAGSIGRTDFPGGSAEKLIDGIQRKLMQLPPDTVIYSGHGPETSLQEEELNNPWLTR